MSRRAALVTLLAAALVVAGVVSYWASKSPDGLDRAIAEHGLQPASAPAGPPTAAPAASPLADYQVASVENRFLSNGLAGLLGALAVLGLMLLVGRLLTRRGGASCGCGCGHAAPRGE